VAAEFGENGADLDVFYLGGIEIWVRGEGRFEDLVVLLLALDVYS